MKPVNLSVNGETFYVTGQHYQEMGWHVDSKDDRNEFHDLVTQAHGLGLIAVLFAQQDDHVEGLIPCERKGRNDSWLSTNELLELQNGRSETYFTPESMWSWMRIGPDGYKRAFFYPSPPNLNGKPMKITRQKKR